MKKCLFFFCAILLISACNDDKKQALSYLDKARGFYENGEYTAAKSMLDSIKARFPKEFEVQKQGLQLMRNIEITEQERNLVYCDSMLIIRTDEAELLKPTFLFEKDPEYDDIGKYMDKQQKVENKLQRSYIRSTVNELGEMSLASVYYGSQPIKHSQLKVSKADGEYADTQDIPYDGGVNYSFTDMGMTTEVVTYNDGKDDGVILFIYNNKDSALKAEYLGGKKYSYNISNADKNAVVKTFEFSVILSDIERLKKEKEKSQKRIEYLQSKLANDTNQEE